MPNWTFLVVERSKTETRKRQFVATNDDDVFVFVMVVNCLVRFCVSP